MTTRPATQKLKDHSTSLRDELLSKRPATALPWGLGPVFTKEGAALFWTDTSKPGKWQRRLDDKAGVFAMDDAAYIVHAANSYPRLMEALSGALDSQECNGHIGVQMVEEIRTLLRSLGESE
jgi:hypothetical protein